MVKLKILYYLLHSAYSEWLKEVWRRDLDERYCCNGRECSCGGETVRDVWTVSDEQ